MSVCGSATTPRCRTARRCCAPLVEPSVVTSRGRTPVAGGKARPTAADEAKAAGITAGWAAFTCAVCMISSAAAGLEPSLRADTARRSGAGRDVPDGPASLCPRPAPPACSGRATDRTRDPGPGWPKAARRPLPATVAACTVAAAAAADRGRDAGTPASRVGGTPAASSDDARRGRIPRCPATRAADRPARVRVPTAATETALDGTCMTDAGRRSSRNQDGAGPCRLLLPAGPVPVPASASSVTCGTTGRSSRRNRLGSGSSRDPSRVSRAARAANRSSLRLTLPPGTANGALVRKRAGRSRSFRSSNAKAMRCDRIKLASFCLVSASCLSQAPTS